jgi:hypothetical protein
MPEKFSSPVHGMNGQDRVTARLQERILQLSELNRACLLGIELTLLSAQNAKRYSGSNGDEIKNVR